MRPEAPAQETRHGSLFHHGHETKARSPHPLPLTRKARGESSPRPRSHDHADHGYMVPDGARRQARRLRYGLPAFPST